MAVAVCSSNGSPPVQNPSSEALLIKNKPTTKHHKTKENRNQELVDEPTHAHTQTFVTASRNWRPRTQQHDERSWVPEYIQLTISNQTGSIEKTTQASSKLPNSRPRDARPRHCPPEYRLIDQAPRMRLSPPATPPPIREAKQPRVGVKGLLGFEATSLTRRRYCEAGCGEPSRPWGRRPSWGSRPCPPSFRSCSCSSSGSWSGHGCATCPSWGSGSGSRGPGRGGT